MVVKVDDASRRRLSLEPKAHDPAFCIILRFTLDYKVIVLAGAWCSNEVRTP